MQRHVLTLPLSKDHARYSKLETDIVHYRLALGQPNQQVFLDSLKRRGVFTQEEIKGLAIDLFPRKMRDTRGIVERIREDVDQVKVLIADVENALASGQTRKDLEKAVRVALRHIVKVLASDPRGLSRCKDDIARLHYFVDPNDDIPDYYPLVGHDDDLAKFEETG